MSSRTLILLFSIPNNATESEQCSEKNVKKTGNGKDSDKTRFQNEIKRVHVLRFC